MVNGVRPLCLAPPAAQTSAWSDRIVAEVLPQVPDGLSSTRTPRRTTVRRRTDHAPPKQTSPQGLKALDHRRAAPRLGGRAPPPHGPLARDDLRLRHGGATR